MITKSHLKNALQKGIILGLCLCLYTLFMWVTKLDSTYLNIGQYLDMAVILLPLGIIFWAIKLENKSPALTLLQKILIAITIGAVSYLIYDPFLYVYHHYINPDWYNAVANLKEQELIQKGVSQIEIASTL
jgi:hypothetical protein